MAAPSRATIVNVGYRSTNYWVVSAGTSRLLVDLGWPETMSTMQASLARKDVPLAELRYALATHYHPDHAGLTEDFARARVPVLIVDVQRPSIPPELYARLTAGGSVTVSCAESRALRERIGIAGEIVHTPGHSDDSVSLVLDDGSAFTGDLTPPGFSAEENETVVAASWALLRARGVTSVYPGHGPVRPMPA